jgi:hypothetical protein
MEYILIQKTRTGAMTREVINCRKEAHNAFHASVMYYVELWRGDVLLESTWRPNGEEGK